MTEPASPPAETNATSPTSSTLPASASVRVLDVPASPLRAYAIVFTGKPPLFYERMSTLLGMLECPVALAAPVGALLMRDADDGEHGVICATKVIGGWRIEREAAP